MAGNGCGFWRVRGPRATTRNFIGWRVAFDWGSGRVGPRERLLLVGTNTAAINLAREMFERYMSFADYCLFATAAPVLQGPGVTVSFACEFLDAAREGELVEGTVEITRAGGSLIFLRGLLTSGERSLFTFSGTIKRVKRRMPPAADAVAT